MNTDLLSTIQGLYVLTRNGELGMYNDAREFHVDASLTAALQEHCVRLVQSHRSGEDQYARIGIIFPTREARPWKTATFFFEESIVRQLYPVGTVNAPLTAFQRKNQINSYYRAVETLINTRSKETQAMMYCPVLFDNAGTLDQHVKMLGRPAQPGDAQTPVVEVLNLVHNVSTTRRDTQALQNVESAIRAALMAREKNRASFTLLDKVRHDSAHSRATDWSEVQIRNARELTLSAKDFDQLHQTQRHEGIERWLEIPYRPINAGDLRRFTHFRDLNNACLDVLAVHSLVYTAPSGTALVEQGMTDKWNLYLLEGTLLLSTSDGRTVSVEGGSQNASAPVAFLKPRKYKVIALTKISFLWIHDAMLQAVREASGEAAMPLSRVNGG